jgi:hypothetical protein
MAQASALATGVTLAFPHVLPAKGDLDVSQCGTRTSFSPDQCRVALAIKCHP